MTKQRALCAVLLFAACGIVTGVADAQRTHVLIVTGLGNEELYTTRFREAGAAVYTAAKTKWGVADSSLIFLAEDPAADPQRIRGKSSKDEIQQAFLTLSRRVAPGDVVLVFVLGHGSGEGVQSRVAVPGPDPSAGDFLIWVSGFTKQTVVFVNASSASGDFVSVLQAPGRVVVTATKSPFERNESVFANFFTLGLVTGEADADKDGRISVLEAFEYAKRETAKSYTDANKIMTEHAVLGDTTLARTTAFGSSPASNDPRVAALVAERRELEDKLTALRARKAQMDSTAYEGELERLLIAIAEKTAAIRKIGGGS